MVTVGLMVPDVKLNADIASGVCGRLDRFGRVKDQVLRPLQRYARRCSARAI